MALPHALVGTVGEYHASFPCSCLVMPMSSTCTLQDISVPYCLTYHPI